MTDITPEELQEKIANHSIKIQECRDIINNEKRKISKLNDDCMTMFQQVTKLRRDDDS